jgi:hypothetical protein
MTIPWQNVKKRNLPINVTHDGESTSMVNTHSAMAME